VIIASENVPEKALTVKKCLESELKKHMLSAAAIDLNPWLQGYGEDIFSKLQSMHPEIGRQTSREISLQNDGWIAADGLFLLAEISEVRGVGLVEFSGPDNTAKLIALSPDSKGLPWKALNRSGFVEPRVQSIPGCCPFWGPCLGHRTYLAEAIIELAEEIEPCILGNFRVELAGCPLDCRFSAAKADLAIILDADASSFVIWLGGRHRPFRDRILPKPWLKQDVSGIKELLDLINKVHDLWSSLAYERETLPELVVRLGLEHLERLMAESRTSKKKKSASNPIEDKINRQP
jgi:dissimilatory sulfite reductase (desulfoviridin) alpha/beta subunit